MSESQNIYPIKRYIDFNPNILDTLSPDQAYISVGNFLLSDALKKLKKDMEEKTEKGETLTQGFNGIDGFCPTGYPDEEFQRLLGDFAKAHGLKTLIREGDSIIMTAHKETFSLLLDQYGDLFTCLEQTDKGVYALWSAEIALLSARMDNATGPVQRENVIPTLQHALNS